MMDRAMPFMGEPIEIYLVEDSRSFFQSRVDTHSCVNLCERTVGWVEEPLWILTE